MKVLQTETLTPESIKALSDAERLWVYNALDCMVTLEVKDALIPQLDNETRNIYEFEKALQGPVLEMDLTGFKVDLHARDSVVAGYRKDLERLEKQFLRLIVEGLEISPDFNWRSPAQLMTLFYEILAIPPIKKRGKVTIDRSALEKLDAYFFAQPFANHILAMRDLGKKISTLLTEIDPDGRLRTSFNIAGTETGRFSSSLSAFGTGGNTQNITDELRSILVADEGMKLAYIDLPQAEARVVGATIWNLFEDAKYLDACESGDLHTSVSKLCWPNLPWSGDVEQDKEYAEKNKFYREFSYRDTAKRLGHGSNYRGQPYTMAKNTKIPQKVVAEFQNVYFATFPGIIKWHEWVANELKTAGKLYTLTNRRRWFMGRRDDPKTIREAVAFGPQGSIGDILNQGMLQLWRANICQVLLQVHDALVIQYPEEKEQEIVPQALKLIEVPVELRGGRIMKMPPDAKVGWNWSKKSKDNPDGMATFIEGKPDQRKRSPPKGLLDIIL